MTLYVPTHRDGTTGLPKITKTAATLWIFTQSHPADWRVEQITAPEPETDEKFLQQIQATQAV